MGNDVSVEVEGARESATVPHAAFDELAAVVATQEELLAQQAARIEKLAATVESLLAAVPVGANV